MGVLTIFLDKIMNLADKDGPMNKSDPYVIFHLEQDNWVMDKNYGKKKSSKKKGELNPVYGEKFEFEVPSLKNLVLTATVWDDDIGSDDKLGNCKINIEELGLSERPTGVDRVVDNNIFSKDARIFLQLSYKE